jgi:hypothetical protein
MGLLRRRQMDGGNNDGRIFGLLRTYGAGNHTAFPTGTVTAPALSVSLCCGRGHSRPQPI